jgi:hypothetical protein
MKELWREYKDWIEKTLPGNLGQFIQHKHFEKAITLFLLIGLGYLALFLMFGKELFQKISGMINAF